MGFGSKLESRSEASTYELLSQVEPQDLVKYGMIPELVGRMPVISVLHELDEDALIRILLEPRNALVKQYERLLQMDNVKLRFTEDALRAFAREAMRRGTGARGLRAILEETMLDVMYEVPSRQEVRECVITEDVVLKRKKATLVRAKAG